MFYRRKTASFWTILHIFGEFGQNIAFVFLPSLASFCSFLRSTSENITEKIAKMTVKRAQKGPKRPQNGVQKGPKRLKNYAKTMPKWSLSDPKVTPDGPKNGSKSILSLFDRWMTTKRPCGPKSTRADLKNPYIKVKNGLFWPSNAFYRFPFAKSLVENSNLMSLTPHHCNGLTILKKTYFFPFKNHAFPHVFSAPQKVS